MNFPLLLILLTPTKSFYSFYLIATILTFFFIKKRSSSNPEVKYLYFAFFLFFADAVLQVLTFGSGTIIDNCKEMARIGILVILCLVLRSNADDRIKTLNSLLVFSLVSLIVSIFQFFRIDFFNILNIVRQFYNLDGMDLLLSGSFVRAIGLSPGPGEQGSIFALFFLYFFISYISGLGKKRFSVLGLFLSLISLILSQSRTSIIAFIFLFTFFMAYFYIIGNRIWKKRIRFIALILISSLLLGVFLIPGSFYYLNQFFQYGASLPSFNARKSIWSELIDYQFQDIRTVLFGVGRTTYGIKTVVYDNEYVYLLVVHGLIFAIAFYVGGLWLVFKTMAKKRFPNFGEYILIGSFIYGIVAGIGLIVFFEPKFSFLALYLYLSYKGVVVKSDSYSNKNTFFRGKHE